MEFMKFDPTKQPHLFFYNNKIIATICGKDGYFLLETYPPLIHNRVILHTSVLKHECIHDSFIQMYSENW